MKLRRRSLFLLYALLVAAMTYSASQLGGSTARADESGVCCGASSQCDGDKLCYAPGDRLACCLSTEMGCKGAGYCETRPPLD